MRAIVKLESPWEHFLSLLDLCQGDIAQLFSRLEKHPACYRQFLSALDNHRYAINVSEAVAEGCIDLFVQRLVEGKEPIRLCDFLCITRILSLETIERELSTLDEEGYIHFLTVLSACDKGLFRQALEEIPHCMMLIEQWAKELANENYVDEYQLLCSRLEELNDYSERILYVLRESSSSNFSSVKYQHLYEEYLSMVERVQELQDRGSALEVKLQTAVALVETHDWEVSSFFEPLIGEWNDLLELKGQQWDKLCNEVQGRLDSDNINVHGIKQWLERLQNHAQGIYRTEWRTVGNCPSWAATIARRCSSLWECEQLLGREWHELEQYGLFSSEKGIEILGIDTEQLLLVEAIKVGVFHIQKELAMQSVVREQEGIQELVQLLEQWELKKSHTFIQALEGASQETLPEVLSDILGYADQNDILGQYLAQEGLPEVWNQLRSVGVQSIEELGAILQHQDQEFVKEDLLRLNAPEIRATINQLRRKG